MDATSTSLPVIHITHLPFELIETILFCCSPITVSAFSQTCRAYHQLVYQSEDSYFWRTLFLRQDDYDDPRLSTVYPDPVHAKIPWGAILHRWVAASNKLRSASACVKLDREVVRVVNEMVAHARPSPSPSANLQTLQRLFEQSDLMSLSDANSSMFDDLVINPGRAQVQLAYRLRVYIGWDAVIRTTQERLRARSFVYNLRHYHDRNGHGPFLSDGSGRVNWGHVFMIQEVIAMNIIDIAPSDQPNLPMSLMNLQPRTPADCGVTDERDWAGITGKWQVIFCFCDHRDLVAFNRMNVYRDQADPAIFEEEGFEEAIRFLDFDLHVTHVEECFGDKNRPKIFFAGKVSSTSRVAGQVYIAPDNQIRWSFLSGEPGNTIWSTEAVQIGGIGSAYGALGTWTTIFHDADDPVGPMWLYKHPVEAGTG